MGRTLKSRKDGVSLGRKPKTAPLSPTMTVDPGTADTLVLIGGRIRDLRSQRGMTLQSLAASSGLSVSMLSLIERGLASPSIGSLVVIARALRVGMADLISEEGQAEEKLVVRSGDVKTIETAKHVIRRLLKEDLHRGVSVAINEYAPHTGSAERPITHDGFEYGFVLEGTLTVEVDGTKHKLQSGDLISYSSTRKHRLWNHENKRVRALWFNLNRG